MKIVERDIWKKGSTITFEDAMGVMYNTHGAKYVVHHGDIWGNNVLLVENKDVVFIDWQMCHEGDPLLDLGMLVGLTLQNDDMTIDNVHRIVHAYCEGITTGNGEERDDKLLKSVLGEDASNIENLIERMQRCFHVYTCINYCFSSNEAYFPADDASIMKSRFSTFLNLRVQQG